MSIVPAGARAGAGDCISFGGRLARLKTAGQRRIVQVSRADWFYRCAFWREQQISSTLTIPRFVIGARTGGF